MSFISQIETLLKENGITKKKMLADLGLSINSFTNWSKRGTIPSAKVLDEIANYFGVSVDYLLEKSSDTNPPEDARLISLIKTLTAEEKTALENFINYLIKKRK